LEEERQSFRNILEGLEEGEKEIKERLRRMEIEKRN
jgi:hypothetical protein